MIRLFLSKKHQMNYPPTCSFAETPSCSLGLDKYIKFIIYHFKCYIKNVNINVN